ncbi:hypothetical protein Ciccas_011326 [Cichlidogyrus casuarinus]|uniref:Uncharacterized protein n=1 Tax=Cichlidogyrus casuarinus TaxID=1844966 RepID=A0ABD2PRJ6_9PLAT
MWARLLFALLVIGSSRESIYFFGTGPPPLSDLVLNLTEQYVKYRAEHKKLHFYYNEEEGVKSPDFSISLIEHNVNKFSFAICKESIALIHNIPELNSSLSLTSQMVGDILTGRVHYWNQADAKLPKKKIRVVALKHSAQLSQVLQQNLRIQSISSKMQINAVSMIGAAALLLSNNYSFGYLTQQQAVALNMKQISLIDHNSKVEAILRIEWREHLSCEMSVELYRFVKFLYQNPQLEALQNEYCSPIFDRDQTEIRSSLLDSLTCLYEGNKSRSVSEMVAEAMINENDENSQLDSQLNSQKFLLFLAVTPTTIILLTALTALPCFKLYKWKKQVIGNSWLLDNCDFAMHECEGEETKVTKEIKNESKPLLRVYANEETVALFATNLNTSTSFSISVREDFVKMLQVSHANVERFYGLADFCRGHTRDQPAGVSKQEFILPWLFYRVVGHCTRGSLYDLIHGRYHTANWYNNRDFKNRTATPDFPVFTLTKLFRIPILANRTHSMFSHTSSVRQLIKLLLSHYK